MFLHLDCRHYLGDRPCRFGRPCEGCPHYHPMGPRVLIVKLAALGDVVRTSALLPGLARRFGEEPYTTWLTSRAALDLVRRMPGVHRALPFGEESLIALRAERFDLVVCLDKEPAPCAAAMSIHALERKGIGLSRYGTPFPLSEEADYYFRLGLDDEEKFRVNRKSYSRLIHEAIGLEYAGEEPALVPTEADRAAAAERFAGFGADAGGEASRGPVRWIGLNPGAGGVFAHKDWPEEKYVEAIRALAARRPDVRFALLGGEREAELLARIRRATEGAPVFDAGHDNPLGVFAALVARCDVVVCGDTLAMHLAIAARRRVVALFGPTCEAEIDLFGRGEKLVSPIECSPCYRRTCDKSPHCQDLIPVERVVAAVEAQLAESDRDGDPPEARP